MHALTRVTLVTSLAVLGLGACTTHAGTIRGDAAPVRGRPLSIRFMNEGRERIHVYLVGERREWLLGRVEPGAAAWLALPMRSLRGAEGNFRLAVLAGAPPSLQAGRDGRAVQSLVEPASAILDREWSFSQGRLVSLWPQGRRAGRR